MGRIRRIAITLALCVLAVTAGLAAGCGGDSGPKIDSVTPNNGEPGSTVTLAGEVFGETQGESTVGFGTVTATVEKWSDGSIAITVPDGLEPGDYEISVTTEEGTSDAVSFTLTEPPAPPPSPTHVNADTVTDAHTDIDTITPAAEGRHRARRLRHDSGGGRSGNQRCGTDVGCRPALQ